MPHFNDPGTPGLAHEISAYQTLLEGHRAFPDDEELYADMLKARRAMEIAWLEHLSRRVI